MRILRSLISVRFPIKCCLLLPLLLLCFNRGIAQTPHHILQIPTRLNLSSVPVQNTSTDMPREEDNSPLVVPILICFDELIQLRKVVTDSVSLAGPSQIRISKEKLDELIALFESQMQGDREIRIVRIEPLQVKTRPTPKIDLKSISMRIQMNMTPVNSTLPQFDED